MELKKPNDIIVATFNNPHATTYDLMSSLSLNPENTSLFKKEEYKESSFIKKNFIDDKGNFDDIAFDQFYDTAQKHYQLMTNEEYLKALDTVWYSPFDVTRPKDAKTFNVSVDYSKDYNPFQQTYGRTSLFSVDESPFSLRELAQKGKIYDTKKGEFLNESVNDRSILGKLFGETLVYAQWDEDGMHVDPMTGRQIKHSKGDWKVNPDGNLYVETLAGREIYGKQVVNPMDALTTDGSFANKFDVFDADNKEKNALKTTLKIAAEIAPLFIPGVNLWYGGAKAALGLSASLPTLYKSFEGILLGDDVSKLHGAATAVEGYMAKFTATSTSDEAQGSFFNYEQMATMVSDIFSQIYEQRAAATLSQLFYHPSRVKLTAKQQQLVNKLNEDTVKGLITGKLDDSEIKILHAQVMSKVPGLQNLQKAQSQMAKSFSLGYMAITATSDIYGEAIEGGYDRRTAGFAGLMAATGTYALMMNNRMGDWFLDETTGYTTEVNKALMRRSIKEYYKPIQEAIIAIDKAPAKGKFQLANAVSGIKRNISNLMNNTSIIGEAMWKNSIIEGIEEVTEEVVVDATKAVVDVMSHLGLTKKKGTFGGVENVFSKEGMERYLSTLLGGVLGGALFEFNRTRIEPWLTGNAISFDAKKSMYEMISNGQTELLINMTNQERKNLGNKYIEPFIIEGQVVPVGETGFSHADAVADATIQMIKYVDGLMNSEGLIISDEEIVRKAIKDFIIIRDLEGSKSEDTKLGIEGLMVDDFRRHAMELTEINGEIKKLEADEKSDNKKAIEDLQEKAKIHRDILQDIKDGKLAQDYFNKIIFYLNKDISKHFLTADLDTFSEIRFERSYYDLPESGLGITKELAKQQWEAYKDVANLRKNLDVAWEMYSKLEKDMNKPASDYSESGYSEQRREFYKNFMDLDLNKQIFDTSDSEKTKQSIVLYLANAKLVEKNTGKKVIPWDSIILDLFDRFNKKGLFVDFNNVSLSDNYFNEEIVTGENKILRKDFISDILTSVLKILPTDNLDFNSIATVFNENMVSVNNRFEKEQEDLLLTKTDENKDEVEKKIQEIENKKFRVRLIPIQVTGKLEAQQRVSNLKLQSEMMRLNLTPELISGFSEEMLNWNFKDFNTSISEFALSIGKNVDELTDEEVKIALNNHILFFALTNPGDNSINELIDSEEDNSRSQLESIINNISTLFEPHKNNYKEYINKEAEIIKDLQDVDFFDPINYTLEAVIREIKSSGNLDGELFLKLEETYLSMINNLKNDYFKSITITDEDFFDLIENVDTIMPEFDKMVIDYLSTGQLMADIPQYLYDILNNSEDLDTTMHFINNSLSDLSDNKRNVSKTLAKLIELKEILKDKDKFIPNTIYDFLNKFMLSLTDEKEKRQKTIFDILKAENLTLFTASDITNYIREGFQERDILQAINILKALKSVVYGTSTTEININEPYGFIQSRKTFAERNETKDDVLKLKTITSDIVSLIDKDLDRVQSKLEFLLQLSRSNSGQIFLEQEQIRRLTNEELVKGWKNLFKEKVDLPDFPDLSNLLDESLDNEKKLLEVENSFFEYFNNSSREDKINLIKTFVQKFKFNNNLSQLYNKEGTNRIDKNIEQLSNNDFLLYLVANLIVNSKDFNNRLKTILEQKSFDKSPFFTQEIAAKIMYASIVDPELFSIVAQDTHVQYNHLTDYITYSLGDSGTGKTTVLFKIVTLLLQNNNPNLSIWFSAPHIDKVNDLHRDVLSGIDYSLFNINKFDKKSLFKELGIDKILEQIYAEDIKNSEIVELLDDEGLRKIIIKDWSKFNIDVNKSNLPDVLFIDEVSHFDALELEILNEFSKRLDGKKLKIVTAGDFIQLGSVNKTTEVSYNIDRVSGIFTPQLSLSVRSANSQKRENADYLGSLLKQSIKIFSSSKDSPEVVKLFDKGILLKHYLSNNVIAGDLLSKTELIPREVLNALKNIVSNDPEIKIGVLSSDINQLDSKLKEQFDSIGILSNNIKLYTVDNVQGSEVDYFILPASFIKGRHVLESLRKLYTYTTRSKQATIILNDEKIVNDDETTLIFKEDKQSDSQQYVPLKEDVIEQNKQERISKLNEILNPDFNIKYDFYKFGSVFMDLDEDSGSTEFNGETREQEHFNPEFEKEKFQYRIHTFYNDINVKAVKNSNGRIKIEGPDSDILLYGLNFLNGRELTQEQYDNYVEELVRLKYDLWKTLEYSSKDKFKVNKNNSLIKEIFSTDKLSSELIIKKLTYDSEYNSAQDKHLDEGSSLQTGDDYYNLMLKVTDGTKTYFIQLATLPLINTINKWFENDKESINKYNEFLNQVEDEVKIDPKGLILRTSTRLLKSDSSPVKYSLSELSRFKGLIFVDGENKYHKTPVIRTFPNNFDKFVEEYNKVKFGEPISDEKLREMFYGKDGKSGYKGKQYIAITFIKSPSQVQYILLKSESRTLKEIEDTIKNPLNLTGDKMSAKSLLMSRSKDEMREVFAVTETLFNGNQVLDMLIKLAIKNPDLFNDFVESGNTLINKVKGLEKDKINDTVLLKIIDDITSKSLIDNITYKKKNSEHSLLSEVYSLIQNEILLYKRSGKLINEKELKKKLISKIQGNPDKKYWWNSFWNIFSYKHDVEKILTLNELKLKNYFDETIDLSKIHLDLINKMINFWSNEFNDKFYYNIPIQTKGSTFEASENELTLTNTYITLTPEGPYLNLNLNEDIIVSKNKKQSTVDKLVNELKGIQLNGNVIINNEPSDTEKTLKEKVKKAKLIKEIINHKDNDNEYELNDLINLSLSDLNQRLKALNNVKKDMTFDIIINEITEAHNIFGGEPMSNVLNNFKLLYNNFDELEDLDKTIISELTLRWKNKVFNGKSLLELLQSLPQDSSLLLEFYTDLTGDTNSLLSSVEFDLTAYIFNKLFSDLDIDTYDSDNKFDNIFKKC